MDPLAHTLFGATMAEAGLKRKTALATVTLIIGANIPDVDAVAMFISQDYALLVRRGWTHGILALLIWPFLLTGTMLAADRQLQRWRNRKSRSPAPSTHMQNASGNSASVLSTHMTETGSSSELRDRPPMRPGVLLGIAFLGVWSHPLLDWVNTYGIRLLMPFNDTWFYGDSLFIIDPWLWLLAGAGVVLARSQSWRSIGAWVVLGTAITALVVSADMVPLAGKIVWMTGIGAIALARWTGRYRIAVQPFAFTMLIAVLLYIAFMVAGARFTAMHARAHLATQGVEATEVMANPMPARPLLRTGVAASQTHYYLFEVNWLRPASFVLTSEPVRIAPPDRIAEAALRLPEVQGLRGWMRFPAYEVRRRDDGWRVFIRDLRYVHPEAENSPGIGMAVVDLDEHLQVVEPGSP